MENLLIPEFLQEFDRLYWELKVMCMKTFLFIKTRDSLNSDACIAFLILFIKNIFSNSNNEKPFSKIKKYSWFIATMFYAFNF